MKELKENGKGILLCFALALPCHFLGKMVPIVGGAVFAIIIGIIVGIFLQDKSSFEAGIKYTSKKILQYAVILLGFGMNLRVVMETGKQSLPIILCTISTSLIVAYIFYRKTNISSNIATLIGVGSSICGGSAVAATAPIVDAEEEEIAQAISVIFLFNILAALLFPTLGTILGFSGQSGEAFGIFAGTAVNDTSSVTATASTWDSMYQLGSQTLDKAVTVKLTRTLAIIPITLVLAFLRVRKMEVEGKKKVSIRKIFPFFILFFIGASLITTIALEFGVSAEVFDPLKNLSKFFIIMAMGAIGLNTDIIKLVKNEGGPILLGAACWASITLVTLTIQHIMHLW